MAYTAYTPVSFVNYDKNKPPAENPANAFWQGTMITNIDGGIQAIESALLAADLNTVSEAGGLVAWGATLGGGGDFLTKAVADTLYPAIADFNTLETTVSGKADTSALSAYLTTEAAASTYLTSAAAATTYLTSADATSTYLTQTAAASTYATSMELTSVEEVAQAASSSAADAMATANDIKIVSGEYKYDSATFEPRELTLVMNDAEAAPITITLTPET